MIIKVVAERTCGDTETSEMHADFAAIEAARHKRGAYGNNWSLRYYNEQGTELFPRFDSDSNFQKWSI